MFEMKSYSRKELVLMYFPGNNLHAARANFTNWLIASQQGKLLYKKLLGKRIFTRKAVEEIVDILGEP